VGAIVGLGMACSSPLILGAGWLLCNGRRGTFALRVGQLLALACLAAGLWGSFSLFEAGEGAHWSSDGAGILFVMIAMVVSAGLAVVFALMLIFSFTRTEDDEPDRLAAVRAIVTALVVMSAAAMAARLVWLRHR